tara:strand:+ start:111 stop:506 length:396 start_codon:yes stop_codon:yes gene_type:complete
MSAGLDAQLPLAFDNTNKFYGLTKTLKDNYRQNIKMLLLTAPGERIMLANYGVGLRNYLFENSPEAEISQKIYEQMRLFLPNVAIIKLSITKNTKIDQQVGQANVLTVVLTYAIKGTSIKDAVKVVEFKPL